jgi:hypothetical protein
LLLEIAKIEDAAEQIRVWRELQVTGKLTVRAAGEARRRGSYKKRYEEITNEQDGLKIMIRWKLNGEYSDRRRALKMAHKLIDKVLRKV